MKKSTEDVKALIKYLRARGFSATRPHMAVPFPVHCKGEDLRHSKDPRAYCSVEPDDERIFCTQSIEDLPTRNRVGILLHEIVHIWHDAFDGDECEVDVDMWILENVPEAHYTYVDTPHPLQSVGVNFLALIGVSDNG